MRRSGQLPAGTTVGRYLVLEAIAQGGMGIVYRALDPELDRTIALKLLRLRPDEPEERERQKARLVRRRGPGRCVRGRGGSSPVRRRGGR